MALFGRKKETKKEESAPVVNVSQALATDYDLTSIITSPKITEKAVGQSERNVYTFTVKRDATKYQVRDAVKALYNVTPVKVNIVNKKPTTRISRTSGTKHVPGMKKAYVYLKEGDTINLV